jgi:hypothetical protein
MAKPKTSDPRSERVADLKPGQYADGSPLHDVQYLECKLILKTDEFTSPAADANVALWRTRGEHLPLVGEFAYQLKFKRRENVHDKARERCAKLFIRPQQIGHAWIYLGATKTGMVYRLNGNPPQAHEQAMPSRPRSDSR